MKQYVVIGLGRFGSSVTRHLSQFGREVLAIDIDEEKVRRMASEATHAVQADTTDIETLKALGIKNFDVAIVAIGADIQASIMTTLLLKELEVPYVVAKASNKLQGKVLEKIGADRVVYPEGEMGKRIAHNLVSSNLLDFIELAIDYRIEEVVAPSWMHGKTLREMNLRNRMGISVIVIKKAGGGEVMISPGAEALVGRGDTMVVIGKNEALDRLIKQLE